jgi:hypothetical protein
MDLLLLFKPADPRTEYGPSSHHACHGKCSKQSREKAAESREKRERAAGAEED